MTSFFWGAATLGMLWAVAGYGYARAEVWYRKKKMGWHMIKSVLTTGVFGVGIAVLGVAFIAHATGWF